MCQLPPLLRLVSTIMRRGVSDESHCCRVTVSLLPLSMFFVVILLSLSLVASSLSPDATVVVVVVVVICSLTVLISFVVQKYSSVMTVKCHFSTMTFITTTVSQCTCVTPLFFEQQQHHLHHLHHLHHHHQQQHQHHQHHPWCHKHPLRLIIFGVDNGTVSFVGGHFGKLRYGDKRRGGGREIGKENQNPWGRA